MDQVIANGLYLGAQYALIALGLTLIFALMNVLNFAHGQMYVLGGFVTYEVYGLLNCRSSSRSSLPALTLAVRRRADRALPVPHRHHGAASARKARCCLRPASRSFSTRRSCLLFGEKQRGVRKIVNGRVHHRTI